MLGQGSPRETAMADSPANVERRYDVELTSVGTKPRRVARTVASFTDLRNEKAKELLRTAPVLILRNASYATAEGAREALERRGATVEVRAYDMEIAAPKPQPSTPTTWGQIALVILMVGILIFVLLALVATLIVANLGDPTF
jgi:ABC-type multidrug transport system fused ATPase/permease subunit